jgi:hypothetical protein
VSVSQQFFVYPERLAKQRFPRDASLNGQWLKIQKLPWIQEVVFLDLES